MPSQIYNQQVFSGAFPGSDNNYALILGAQETNSTVTDCTVDGTGLHWGFKMTGGNSGSIINHTNIIGGKSRALDIVQCKNVQFNDCYFGAGKDREMTKSQWSFKVTCDIGIKGGSKNIDFNRCTMADLLLGDHDIYDNPHIGPKVSAITLTDCKHPAGSDAPIIIRCLNAERPTLVRTNAVVLCYWRFVVLAYFWYAGKFIDSRVGVPIPL